MKLEDAIKSTKFNSEVQKASLNILYTSYWLKSKFSKNFKEMGITPEQFNVMRILKGKYPDAMCVKDISSRILEKSSNVPRIVDRLVLKNYVKRTDSLIDKRETLMQLTESGLELVDRATIVIDNLGKEIIGINEKEASDLNEMIEKFRKID